MLPTPSTSHIDPSRVYDPAEDSFLLLDALAAPTERAFLTARFPPHTPTPLALDIGTGSGVLLAFVAAHARALLGRPDVLALGTDVNRTACAAAARTAGDTAAADAPLLADLAAPLRPRSVDLLVFNPPYVPSDELPALPANGGDGEVGKVAEGFALLALATDGGRDGMQVTQRLLAALPAVLSARGVAYVLLCRRNRPADVQARVRAWGGGGAWRADVVRDSGRTGGLETLCILRIARAV